MTYICTQCAFGNCTINVLVNKQHKPTCPYQYYFEPNIKGHKPKFKLLVTCIECKEQQFTDECTEDISEWKCTQCSEQDIIRELNQNHLN